MYKKWNSRSILRTEFSFPCLCFDHWSCLIWDYLLKSNVLLRFRIAQNHINAIKPKYFESSWSFIKLFFKGHSGMVSTVLFRRKHFLKLPSTFFPWLLLSVMSEDEVSAAAAEVPGIPGGWQGPGGTSSSTLWIDATEIQYRAHSCSQWVRRLSS